MLTPPLHASSVLEQAVKAALTDICSVLPDSVVAGRTDEWWLAVTVFLEEDLNNAGYQRQLGHFLDKAIRGSNSNLTEQVRPLTFEGRDHPAGVVIEWLFGENAKPSSPSSTFLADLTSLLLLCSTYAVCPDPITPKKRGRPVTTVRDFDADAFLTGSLPKLEATLDELHKPILERFQQLLDQLKGKAAPTFEENRRVAEEVARLAERYGVELVFEKDGVRSAVKVWCVDQRTRGTGQFFVRTRGGSKQLGNFATWPPLHAESAFQTTKS